MNRTSYPTIGADVECFLMSTETTDYIPCVDIIPGTKENPFQVPSLPEGFCTQEDNVMLEWNIPPVKTAKHFAAAVKKMNLYLRKELQPKGYQPLYADALWFPPKHLQSEQAKTFGCDPDFDAYQGGRVRTVPEVLGGDGWRGAGGHVHIGGDFQCPDFVVALFCDLFIGVHAYTYNVSERTDWYGKPGIFRPKPYGIEYRTPGGSWGGSGDSAVYVGTGAYRLAKYLIETDAAEIQEAFSQINWSRVHSYVSGNFDGLGRGRMRNQIITEAKQAGVQL